MILVRYMDLRLKELREDRDLTQSKVAKILNISQRAYSHYETGNRTIPLELLVKLADYYDTSVDYILKRKKRNQ